MTQIVSIQILRAMAAMAIVVAHALHDATLMGRNTSMAFTAPDWPLAAGVDLFFVISGVVMVVASRHLFTRKGAPLTFLARRIARIVPIYWLVTSVFLAILWVRPEVLNSQFPSWIDVFKSYSFIPFLKEADDLVQPVYKLGWTLNYEMMFYCAFAAVVALPMRSAIIALTTMFAGLVAAGLAFSPANAALAFWTSPIILEFVGGMWIGYAFLRNVRLSPAIGVGFVVAGLGLLIGLDQVVTDNLWLARLLNYGIPVVIVTAGCVLGLSDLPDTARPVRVLVLLGDASYALYLFHPFAVRLFRLIWERSGAYIYLGAWPYILMACLSASVIALLIYRYVETPLTRLAQRVLGVQHVKPIKAHA